MTSRTVAVASQVGLHARPASVFTQAVLLSGMNVTLSRPGGEPQDARSILSVMGLAVKHGEAVELHADGPGSEQVLDELVTLLATDLDVD